MAKIVLSDEAPDGQPLSAAFGASRFDADGGSSFETDDHALIAGAEAHPYFEVEYDEPSESDVRATEDAINERHENKLYNATKDPREPGAEVLRSEGDEVVVPDDAEEPDPEHHSDFPESEPQPKPDGGDDGRFHDDDISGGK